MLDTTTHRNCPACAHGDAQVIAAYSPDPWEVVACAACGFVYLRNAPDYEALKEDLAFEKTYAAKKAADAGGSTTFSPIARKIRRTLRMRRDRTAAFRRWFNDGHVLDVGCGGGGRIRPPMTPYGIELSTAAHRRADELMRGWGGYCLHGAGAERIWDFDEGQFDGIVMHSYLEHEKQVMDALEGAYRALKQTGAIFIRVPNYGSLNRRLVGPKWCGFRYPDHVNYFTLQSLRDVAERAGFTTRLINRLTLPVDDNLSVLLRKSGA